MTQCERCAKTPAAPRAQLQGCVLCVRCFRRVRLGLATLPVRKVAAKS